MWLKRLECWLHIHIIGRIFVNIILINTGCDRWQNNRVIIITRYLRGKRYVFSRLRGCNNISGKTVISIQPMSNTIELTLFVGIERRRLKIVWISFFDGWSAIFGDVSQNHMTYFSLPVHVRNRRLINKGMFCVKWMQTRNTDYWKNI